MGTGNQTQGRNGGVWYLVGSERQTAQSPAQVQESYLGASAEQAQRVCCGDSNRLSNRDGKRDCGTALGLPAERKEQALDTDLGSTIRTLAPSPKANKGE